MIRKLLCWLKQHSWIHCNRQRWCQWCGQYQEIVFYSNRTSEWKDIG